MEDPDVAEESIFGEEEDGGCEEVESWVEGRGEVEVGEGGEVGERYLHQAFVFRFEIREEMKLSWEGIVCRSARRGCTMCGMACSAESTDLTNDSVNSNMRIYGWERISFSLSNQQPLT